MAVSLEIASELCEEDTSIYLKDGRDEASVVLLRERVADSCCFSVKVKASDDTK